MHFDKRPVDDFIARAAELRQKMTLTLKLESQAYLFCKTTSHPTKFAQDDMPPLH
jgi:hypothetical protein